jgi:hypothetical protein
MSSYIIFAFTDVLENLVILFGDFGMNSDSIDYNEAMKREARR